MDLSLDGPYADIDVAALTDEQLAVLAVDVAAEQQRRAVESRDLAAISAAAFDEGFAGKRVMHPWMDGGLVLCPGQIVDKSKQSHDCTFVTVRPPGETSRWVWESDACLSDEIRKLPGERRHQQSVSMLAAVEGLELDVVTMQLRQGRHKLVAVASYEVRSGELVAVPSRSKAAPSGASHR